MRTSAPRSVNKDAFCAPKTAATAGWYRPVRRKGQGRPRARDETPWPKVLPSGCRPRALALRGCARDAETFRRRGRVRTKRVPAKRSTKSLALVWTDPIYDLQAIGRLHCLDEVCDILGPRGSQMSH